MSELAAKLARRTQLNEGGESAPGPQSRASIAPVSKSKVDASPASPSRDGPSRAPVVGRMAATMAPGGSKPPPPSRSARPKIDTGADSSVANARASILSKGLFGAPAAGGGPRAAEPPAETPAPRAITPRKAAPPPPSPRNRSIDSKPTPSPGLALSSPATSDRRPGGLKKPPEKIVPPSFANQSAPTPSPRGGISRPTPAAPTPAAAAPTPVAPTPAAEPDSEEPKEMKARALFDYAGAGQENELLFSTGDEIEVLQKDDSGWWEGVLNGTRGWFPAEFVEEVEEPKGPTIAERMAEVGSTEQRLAAPKKAVRSGRRPPTRGKRAGAAVKNVRTETNDPPADIARLERTDVKISSPGPSRAMGPVPIGGPSRSAVSAMRDGLRRTAAPGSLGPTSKTAAPQEEKTVDFRANLRSTIAPAASLGIKKGSTPPPEEPSGGVSPRFEAPKRPTPAAPSPRKPLTKQRSQTTTEPPPRSLFENRNKTPTKTPPAAPVPSKPAPAKPTPAAAPAPEPVAPTPAPTSTRPKPSPVPATPAATPSAAAPSPSSSAASPTLPSALGNYESFCSTVGNLFESVKKARATGDASVRPYLNKANSSHFAFALCTVDGVVYQLGDTQQSFTLQEAAYPFLYATALSVLGRQSVRGLVSDVPATPDSPMTLDNHKAQNPLCHAGALALCSALYEGQDVVDRSFELSEQLSNFSSSGVGCCMADVFASKKYNNSAKALAYWMQTSVPLLGNVKETIDLFFQTNATFVSISQLASMAATLANKGQCPTNGTQVVPDQVVQEVTNQMSKCLLQSPAPKHPTWAGESGAMFTVIPGVGGLAFYSPALNRSGLSSRGLRLCNDIVKEFNL